MASPFDELTVDGLTADVDARSFPRPAVNRKPSTSATNSPVIAVAAQQRAQQSSDSGAS